MLMRLVACLALWLLSSPAWAQSVFTFLTSNTPPFWPYTLIDSIFDGQREAAIREHMAGLTVVRTTCRNVPVGISIDGD